MQIVGEVEQPEQLNDLFSHSNHLNDKEIDECDNAPAAVDYTWNAKSLFNETFGVFTTDIRRLSQPASIATSYYIQATTYPYVVFPYRLSGMISYLTT